LEKALEHNGDWYCNGDELYIYHTEKLKEIEYKASDISFDFTGSKFLNIKNLNFFSTRVVLDECESCGIDSCDFKYVNEIEFFETGFVQVTPELTVNSTGAGIYLSGSNNKIENSLIRYASGSGVTISGDYNEISNCIIRDTNYSGTDCGAIQATGEGHIVSHNTIYDCGRFGISHRFLRKSKLLYNHIFNFGLLTDDLGATYCYETDGEGTEIAYNWIYNGKAQKVSVGIYIDNDSANHYIHHNFVWGVSDGIRINLTNENAQIYNNCLFDVEAAMGFWGPDDSVMKGIDVYNNISEDSLWMGNKLENNKKVPLDFEITPQNIFKKALENGLFESEDEFFKGGANLDG
jgi:hypothetical protein